MQCKCDRNFISEKSRQWRDFFLFKLFEFIRQNGLTAKKAAYAVMIVCIIALISAA